MLLTDKNVKEQYLVYPHQVAGHRFEDGKTGILIDNNNYGTLLKPIQEPPRGEREVSFYQNVFTEDADIITYQLRSLVPKFYGVKFITTSHKTDKYIQLEDVTRHFFKPCVLDVKIGRVTFDHLASESKRQRGISKYPEQELFGFRILGMKVFDKDLKEFQFYNKSFGKKLKTHHDVTEGLQKFFSPQSNGIEHVLKILDKCKEIKKWFLKQRKFRIFSSSVLIVYEGDPHGMKSLQDHHEPTVNYTLDRMECKKMVHKMKMGKEDGSVADQPSVHLIDFAHTYIENISEADENYLYGIQCFIQCLEQLVVQYQSSW